MRENLRIVSVPIKPQPPTGFRSVVSDHDNKGQWWFTDMPKMNGIFNLNEFSKWSHAYPVVPHKVGDVALGYKVNQVRVLCDEGTWYWVIIAEDLQTSQEPARP